MCSVHHCCAQTAGPTDKQPGFSAKPGAKTDQCLCSFDDFRQISAAQHLGLLSSEHPETLVLYTYSNSDTEYERNLHYFVEHGMADGDGCDYVIIVQEVSLLQT